jgi:hypothetical protein
MRLRAALPVFLLALWTSVFLFTRVFLFYEAYQTESKRKEDERWLRVRCQEPEFYSNMKQHSDLCNQVEINARRSTFLTALHTVLDSTYLCGYESCLSLAGSAASWIVGAGMPFVAVVVVLLLLTPTLLYPCFRIYLDRMADRRIMSLYNAPYGMDRYVEGHRSSPMIQDSYALDFDYKKIV